MDHSLWISSVSEVWGVCIPSLYKFHVFSVQCMIIHINVCDIERSSGFLVSIFKLPAERTTASLSISIRQSVAPILRFHLAPRELPSLSRHEGRSSHRAGDGRTLFFSQKYIFIGPESDHWLCLSLTNSLTDSVMFRKLDGFEWCQLPGDVVTACGLENDCVTFLQLVKAVKLLTGGATETMSKNEDDCCYVWLRFWS